MEASYQGARVSGLTRSAWVDVARCFAMFFIMWLHTRQDPEWILLPMDGGIALFFLLAGYFMPMNVRACAKRTLQLLIAWLLWSVISVALYKCFFPQEALDWRRVFCWEAMGYNPPLWFLRNLVAYHAIFLLLLFCRLLPWGAWVVFIVCCLWPFTKEGMHHITLRFDWMIVMSLGVAMSRTSLQSIGHSFWRYGWLIALICAALISVQIWHYPFIDYHLLSYRGQLWNGWEVGGSFSLAQLPLAKMGVCIGFLLLAVVIERLAPWLARLLAMVGANMMFIYAFHSLVYGVHMYVDETYFGYATDAWWTVPIIMVLLAGLSALLKRLTPRLMVWLGCLSVRK